MKLGDAIVRFGADTTDFDSGLRHAESGTRSTMSTIGDIAKTAVGTAIGYIGARVVEKGGEMLATMARQGVNAFVDYEALESTLGNLLAHEAQAQRQAAAATGDHAKAAMSFDEALASTAEHRDALLQWIDDMSMRRPFSREAIASALQQAMAYGLTSDQAQAATEAMLTYGTATNKTSADLGRIALAEGQMARKGQLYAQEVHQLGEVGVDTYGALARYLGKSNEEVQAMTAAGLIPADTAIAALNADMMSYGGAADNAGFSMKAMVQTLGNLKTMALGTIFEGFLAPLEEPLKHVVQYLRDPNNGLRGALDGVATAISERVAPTAERLTEIIDRMIAGFKSGGLQGAMEALNIDPAIPELFGKLLNIVAQLAPIIADLAVKGLGLLVNTILPPLAAILKLVNDHFGAFKVVLAGVATVLVVNGLVGLILGLSTNFGLLATSVTSLPGLLAKVGEALPGIATAASTIGTMVLSAFGSIVTFVTGTLIPTLVSAGGAVVAALGPVGIAIAAVIAIVGLLALAWRNDWGGIQEKTAAVWAVLQPIFAAVGDWLGVKLTQAAQILSSFWTGTLQPALASVGNFISSSILPVFATVADWLGARLTQATRALSSLWTGVLQPALSAVRGFISGALSSAFGALVGLLSGAVSGATRSLSSLWTGVLQPALSAVSGFVSGALSGAFNALIGLLNGAVSYATRALSGLWTGVLQPALGTVSSFISGTVIASLSSLAGIIGGALSAAVSGLAGLWSGVLRPAIDNAVGAFNRVIGVIQGALGSAVSTAQSWLSGLAGTISGAVNGALSGMVGTANSVAGAISGISGAVQGALSWLDGLAGKLGEVASKIPSVLMPGSPTPFERGIRGISDAIAELARVRLPELATQFSLSGGVPEAAFGGTTVYTDNRKYFDLTAQYRNAQQETSLRDTIAALSLL